MPATDRQAYDEGAHRRIGQRWEVPRAPVMRRANKANPNREPGKGRLFPASLSKPMPQHSPNWIDLKAVKQAVSIETALSRYNVTLRRIGSNVLRGPCPLPAHDPQKKGISFIANLVKNVWSCHSQSCAAGRAGKIGGNVLDFVAAMEGCSILEAAKKIQGWGATPTTRPPAPEQQQPDQGGKVNRPLRFTLRGLDSSHPYLTERGVKPETAASFGIGYYGQAGLMQGRVAIPVHNENGEVVAYAGRSIDGREPKYRFPRGFHKGLELFNIHRAKKTKGGKVIVVEGFFDALQVHQAGFPNVVALMGTTLSEAQLNTLAGNFQSAVLMLDGDGPGRAASPKIADQFGRRMAVRVITPPDGKQPDQLDVTAIRALLEPERQRPGNRQNLSTAESQSLRRGQDEAKLEV